MRRCRIASPFRMSLYALALAGATPTLLLTVAGSGLTVATVGLTVAPSPVWAEDGSGDDDDDGGGVGGPAAGHGDDDGGPGGEIGPSVDDGDNAGPYIREACFPRTTTRPVHVDDGRCPRSGGWRRL